LPWRNKFIASGYISGVAELCRAGQGAPENFMIAYHMKATLNIVGVVGYHDTDLFWNFSGCFSLSSWNLRAIDASTPIEK